MLVISFYTIDTPYEKEIQILEANLKKLNLPYHFEGYESRGSWVQNCAIKPKFILSCLEQFPNEEVILYVDCDARIHSIPMPEFEDIGVHYKNNKSLLSGTIFLRNNERTINLVRQWAHNQQSASNRWDQKVLQETLLLDPIIKITRLPPQYTQIFDTMAHFGKPVIEHFQASRRYKAVINKKGLICGIRVRENPDGSISLPRCNREIILALEKDWIKSKNENTWYPKGSITKSYKELLSLFSGKVCYIVGKGPSLDLLTKENFESGTLIICINESIRKIESLDLPNQLLMLQYDVRLRNTCQPSESTILLLNNTVCPWYSTHESKYKFQNSELNLSGPIISATCAISICRELGTKLIRFLAFDAVTSSDTSYAASIGYPANNNGDPKRFLKHKELIDRALRDFPHSWPKLKDQIEEVSYTPVTLQDNLEGHHDADQELHLDELITTEESI